MFFDTHCHLNDKRYENDIEGYVERAKAVGVNYLLIVAWDVKSSKKQLKSLKGLIMYTLPQVFTQLTLLKHRKVI